MTRPNPMFSSLRPPYSKYYEVGISKYWFVKSFFRWAFLVGSLTGTQIGPGCLNHNLRRGSQPLNPKRNTHASADAQRGKAIAYFAFLHFMNKRCHDSRSRTSDWMSQRDCAPIDV